MCSPTSNICGPGSKSNCMCGCSGHVPFISKKKQMEQLNKYRECLQEKLTDIDEYIKEMSE